MVLNKTFPLKRSRAINYYNFSIGDFNKNTRHLTLVERALYRELIDLYYESEKPIPADDLNRLAKRVGAKTDEDKAALQEVLGEFFYLENGAYHHSRCDAEILIYKEKIEKASLAGKASALSRAKRAVNKRSTGVKQTINETPTPNPNPTTQSQVKTKPMSGKPDYPLGFQKFWKAWPNTTRKGGRPDSYKVWVKRKCEDRADAILAHLETMKATADWRGGFEPMPTTYLNREQWDGAEGNATASGEKPWFINGWSSVVAKGKEHGLIEDEFPSPPEFRSAVLLAAGVTPAMIKQAEADWK